MNNFRYKLISPEVIKKIPTIEKITKNDIVVRPYLLSICAADQRYFFGNRNVEILNKKLPLVLIHEAIGTVVDNNNNDEYKNGDYVILYPNLINKHTNNENYNKKAKFMSSNTDGFMQELVIINKNNLIKINQAFLNKDMMVFCELLSVVVHAIESSKSKIKKAKTISLWGDGNLSFLAHLYLINKYPNKKYYLYGINEDKLQFFSKRIETINILKTNNINACDLAIEMVGGSKSENVIDNIINHINPTGTIILLGVSENKININTRLILEKGLTLIGRSRSSKNDFILARNFIYDHYEQLKPIISEMIEVKNIDDIYNSFKKSKINRFKTIMKWNI